MNLVGAKNFQVLSGKILLAPDPDLAWSKGGIFFPDSMKKKAESGLCVQHQPLILEEDLTGRRLLVEKWLWTEIELEGQPFLILDERSVFAVLETGDLTPSQEGA
jgi:co-chaperonin GroES (HSP10)